MENTAKAPPLTRGANGHGTARPDDEWSGALESPGPLNRAVVGLAFFLGTEVMFFGGLISTFLILRASAVLWPPPGQPRLPIGVTAVNTGILLASGVAAYRALQAIRDGSAVGLVRWLTVTALLGALFLGVQGSEWVRLVGYGLTFSSSVYGGTFYTLIGAHGLHVLGGLTFLLVVLRKAAAGRFSPHQHTAVLLSVLYWFFVVGIWPVLYGLVYLS